MSVLEAMMLVVIQSQSDLIGKLIGLLEVRGVEPTAEVDAAIRTLHREMGKYEAQLDYNMKKMAGTETH